MVTKLEASIIRSAMKRKIRRSRGRKRKSFPGSSTPAYSIYTNNIGIGKTRKVTLYYNQYVPFVSTVGASTNAVFNLTSIYDPDTSGIGHQPLGHDEYAGFYKYYQVIGAKCTFTFLNVGTNATPCRVGVIYDQDGTVSSVLSTKVERSGTKHTRILNTNSREKVSISTYFTPKKAFDKATLSQEQDLRATMSSNPSLQYYAVPWVQSLDSATTSGTVACDVSIEYIVVLSDPVDIVGS